MRPRRAAFTLIEMLIATSLLVVGMSLSGVIVVGLLKGYHAIRRGAETSEMRARIIAKISADARASVKAQGPGGEGGLVALIAPDGSQVTYRLDGSVVWRETSADGKTVRTPIGRWDGLLVSRGWVGEARYVEIVCRDFSERLYLMREDGP